MNSFLAVLPTIMPDLTRRCIASMAPELRANLLLIDNTETGEIAQEHRGDVMFTVAEMKNTGVTHAWEDGRKMAVAQERDWLVLVSQSMRFGAAGGMDLLDATVGEPHCVHGQYGWHHIALSMDTLEIVGGFDPIFPLYGQDTDWLWRAHVAGLPSPRENDGRYTQIMLNADCEPPAAVLRAGVVKMNYEQHLAQYRIKWLGDQGHETTTHPYGDPRLDWRYVGEYQGANV